MIKNSNDLNLTTFIYDGKNEKLTSNHLTSLIQSQINLNIYLKAFKIIYRSASFNGPGLMNIFG